MKFFKNVSSLRRSKVIIKPQNITLLSLTYLGATDLIMPRFLYTKPF